MGVSGVPIRPGPFSMSQYHCSIGPNGMCPTNDKTSIPWHVTDVRLSWLQNASSRPLFPWAILTRKVGRSDPVFGVRSWFISRSARKLTSLCVQRLRFVNPYLTQNCNFTFWPLWPRKVKVNYCTRQMHLHCKFGDRRSVTCRDAHIIFSMMT